MNKDCKIYAELLGDYQSISINNLMDGYCKALDEADDINQNCYLSALVLRFWYVINKLYLKCPNIGLDHADFFMWLVEAINYAAKYRAWQKGTITAQACINQCINTIRLQHYYEYNLDKHRANYNTMSANTPIGEDDQTIEDLLEAEPEFIHRGSLVDYVVQTYINSNQVIEAVIFDNIAYNDCNRVTKSLPWSVYEPRCVPDYFLRRQNPHSRSHLLLCALPQYLPRFLSVLHVCSAR